MARLVKNIGAGRPKRETPSSRCATRAKQTYSRRPAVKAVTA